MALKMDKEGVPLSVFTEKQQDAIIGWMLKERHFFINCIIHLERHYFVNPMNGAVFQAMLDWNTTYKRAPSIEELKGSFNRSHHNEFTKYHDRINMCISSISDFGIDALSREMTGWMRTIKLAKSITEAEKLYNSKAFSQAYDFVAKKSAEINKTTFEQDQRVVFGDALTFFSDRIEEHKDCLTIGHPDFDILLREEARKENAKRDSRRPSDWTNGGLVKGDTTIILGPSNSGKTTTLTSIIIPNILNNKHVLYFTHEQKWEDIKTKLFMNACRATQTELKNPTPEMKRVMDYVGSKLDEYLVYIPWIKAGKMWVEDVINEITLQQELLKADKGTTFDLLINDYPGKLKSKEMKGRQGWEESDYVYDQFVNAATEWRFHAILPVQTNREGYKVNRGDSADGRVIDQADTSGSFGIMQKADNVITLNRSPKEQALNIMRFYISKSRTQGAQTTFATKTDFARSSTHGPSHQSVDFTADQEPSISSIMLAFGIQEENKANGGDGTGYLKKQAKDVKSVPIIVDPNIINNEQK